VITETEGRFSRTELLYGPDAVKALAGARVAVFGLGGVGGYVVEALARSGVGALDLVDHDRVALSNLNRQIIATERTLGQYKVDVAGERVLSINPDCTVTAHRLFFLPETAGEIDFSVFDYVADAVDNITAKLTLIECAKHAGIPVISAMGTGNKLDPAKLRVSDIYETSVCPLARVMRKECRRRGVTGLKVVWSEEEPMVPPVSEEESDSACPEDPARSGGWKRITPASNAAVPATAGLLMASEIINDLIKRYR
jgi:tRNA A37 threonylcarbamoyladenosine dehydratase